MGGSTTAQDVLTTLRRHEAELRGAGVCGLSLFGSVARGEDGQNSDVDLAVELDPSACIGLVGLSALERHLAELLGRRVDLMPEPAERPRFRESVDRDRVRAF